MDRGVKKAVTSDSGRGDKVTSLEDRGPDALGVPGAVFFWGWGEDYDGDCYASAACLSDWRIG